MKAGTLSVFRMTPLREAEMANLRLCDLGDLIGRILLAALFLWDGWIVVGNYSGTVDYLRPVGIHRELMTAAAR